MSDQVRQRTGKGTAASPSSAGAKGAKVESSGGIGILDIARTIVLIFGASALLSKFITGKDYFWGFEPSVDSLAFWKNGSGGQVVLTDEQLKKYDGSDPTTPIYLAINGTIYDVTAGRSFYGPTGTYSHFAGGDATRAFITTCFDPENITPDVRGVEEMFLPLDNPEVDSLYTKGQLKSLREQERRVAKKKAEEALNHWIGFFSNSKKYHTVGYVKRSKGWEAMGGKEPPAFCGQVEGKRPVRQPPPGKKVPKKADV